MAYQNRRRRRRYNVKNIVLFALLAVLLMAGVIAVIVALTSRGGNDATASSNSSGSSVSSDSGSGSSPSSSSVVSDPDDSWQLILTNPDNFLPEGFAVDLTTIGSNYPDIPARTDLTMQVDSRIVEPLQQMFRDAKAAGQALFLRASYRTLQLQQTYYDWHINDYKSKGYSDEEAKELTLKYIAYPGTSEHHTGLAVDIISVEWQNSGKEIIDTFDQTTEAEWLKNNAHKYGFIMRFPKDKESITKIEYEPWHFRYVGVAHATAIYNAGLCFEEYLETLK